MTSITMGLTSATCIFGGTLIGVYLSKILPIHHLSTDSKDTIKMVSGIIATLSALVVSLLIASAKTTYDTINNEVVQASAKMIMLNEDMVEYGPETKPAREILLASITSGVNKIWGTGKNLTSGSKVIEHGTGLQRVQQILDTLEPKTEQQKHALAKAEELTGVLLQSRWLIIEESQGSLPPSLFFVLLAWQAMLFIGIGLFAPPNGTVLCAVFFCAISLSIAIFVIEEMNRPLDGLIKVPSSPMLKVIEHLSARD